MPLGPVISMSVTTSTWSGQQRTNVEAARDAGVNLQFWSGNEVYWRTRWGNAISADGTPYRTLIS